MLTTKIVSKPKKLESSKKLRSWELSIKSSLLAGKKKHTIGSGKLNK